MSTINDAQKQLLFDHAVGISSENEAFEAEELISCNTDAAKFYNVIKASLSPLDRYLESESCPEYLAERTILRLNNASNASQLKLQQLIAAENTRQTRRQPYFRANLFRVSAAAALFLFAALITLPSFGYMRQNYWQQKCLRQLANVGLGINNYKADNEQQLPVVATASGAPWWKIGQRGSEPSNTQNAFILVKRGYVKAEDFICPASKDCSMPPLDVTKLSECNDFPSRKYITFSLRIFSNDPQRNNLGGSQPLVSDLSPLFEQLPQTYTVELRVQLNDDLRKANSTNHNRKGQNVLYHDGRVKFHKTRTINAAGDDIFTLKGTELYKGREIPSNSDDVFLAP